MRANLVVCCLSHFFFRGSDLFSITAQSAVVSNADVCSATIYLRGRGGRGSRGRSLALQRLRPSGCVAPVVSEPRASGRAKELFVTVSLPLFRPLVSRPYVGLTAPDHYGGPLKWIASVTVWRNLERRVVPAVDFSTDIVFTCLTHLKNDIFLWSSIVIIIRMLASWFRT